jgi:undecaprenyl-phosphate alpha-N-acetylglucosaminyl 1-phosphatetransferase
MHDEKFVAASAIAAAVTLATIFWLRPLARRIGLVDRPSNRKRHRGRVPLIGGLCFFLGTIAGLLYFGDLDRFIVSVLAIGAILVLFGLIDDLHDLSPRTRLLIQACTVVLMMAATGLYVDSVGNLFGDGAFRLYLLGIPLTVVAVVGLVNAFNMLDGIDGLAGSLAMVSIVAILAFSGVSLPATGVLLMLQILAIALVPYLMVNLGWPDGRRIFMGDAGSTLIGFLLAWSVIHLSQRDAALAPVDVLWCIALPVMDTLAVMYRRMRLGLSPFLADRRHVHHLLLDAGFSPRKALALIVAGGALLAWLGHALRDAPELLSLAIFLGMLTVYVLWVPRAVAWLRMAMRGRLPLMFAGAVSGAMAGYIGKWLNPASREQIKASFTWRAESMFETDTVDPPRIAVTASASTVTEEDDGRSQQPAPEHDGRVKALCVLDGTPDDLEMVPIVQQLSADARFNARICVAGLADDGSAYALYRSGDQAGPDPDIHYIHPEQDPAGTVSVALDDMKRVINAFNPDVVLVHGESPTVLATALVAYYQEIPVAHMEISRPAGHVAPPASDEVPGRIINTLASLHFTSTERAGEDLIAAGIPQDRITITGHARIGARHAHADARDDACVCIAEALASLPQRMRVAPRQDGGVTSEAKWRSSEPQPVTEPVN